MAEREYKTTKARRDSNKKWDEAHRKVISTKVTIEEAEAFKRYAEERNAKMSNLLSGYIRRCLAADQAEKDQAEKEKTGKG